MKVKPPADATEAELNPQPKIWPVCKTCDTPWALRRVFTLGSGSTWLWTRDCKHKGTDAQIRDEHGPLEESA